MNSYRVRVLTVVLALGCSTSAGTGRPPVLENPLDGAATDAPADATADIPADVSADIPADVPAGNTDAPADVATGTDSLVVGDEAHGDAMPTPTDGVSDGATLDASTDTGPGPLPDAGMTTDVTLVTDLGMDVTVDAGVDTGVDVVTDTGVDAGRAMDALTDAASATDAADAGVGGPWVPLGDGGCNARERGVPTLPGSHVDPDAGTPVWLTNPPSSGPHFPLWAHWGVFPNIPRGNYLHNEEHGGVAMLYRCVDGTSPVCFAARDALAAAVETIPPDPLCTPTDAAPARVRVVVTNDGLIETAIAGAAWGWLYAADCVDPASIRDFYARHSGMAPAENFCADGFVP